ncbi:MAG: hypothetical protein JSW36_02535 [Burkholderiales bacterium]|nr:MAG: hypothetical protein JSW36_02535 [Burkholderiales bacterium]
MLRAIVVVLLAVNVGFWAWTQGWLDLVVGVPARGDREPGRLGLQVAPDLVRVTPVESEAAKPVRREPAATSPPAPPVWNAPDAAGTAEPPPVAPAQPDAAASETSSTASPQAAALALASATLSPDCLEAGPFTPAERVAAETALVSVALPPDAYRDVAVRKPGTWIVYMGRYPDAAQLADKVAQIKRIGGINFEHLRGLPQLEPGLALGRFSDRASAESALADLNNRGIRTARVVTLAAPVTMHRLRAESPDAELKKRLLALKLPALAKGFVRCVPNGSAGAFAQR